MPARARPRQGKAQQSLRAPSPSRRWSRTRRRRPASATPLIIAAPIARQLVDRGVSDRLVRQGQARSRHLLRHQHERVGVALRRWGSALASATQLAAGCTLEAAGSARRELSVVTRVAPARKSALCRISAFDQGRGPLFRAASCRRGQAMRPSRPPSLRSERGHRAVVVTEVRCARQARIFGVSATGSSATGLPRRSGVKPTGR